MLTSSTQLKNISFHVVERTRTSSKCQKMKNARAKRAKNLNFYSLHSVTGNVGDTENDLPRFGNGILQELKSWMRSVVRVENLS